MQCEYVDFTAQSLRLALRRATSLYTREALGAVHFGKLLRVNLLFLTVWAAWIQAAFLRPARSKGKEKDPSAFAERSFFMVTRTGIEPMLPP